MAFNIIYKKVETVLLGAIGGGLAFIILNAFNSLPPSIASVDVTGIVNEFVATEGKKSYSPEEMQKSVSQFGQKLDVVLMTLEHEKNIVLVPKQALITKQYDVTQEVMQKLGLSNE